MIFKLNLRIVIEENTSPSESMAVECRCGHGQKDSSCNKIIFRGLAFFSKCLSSLVCKKYRPDSKFVLAARNDALCVNDNISVDAVTRRSTEAGS